MAFGVGTVVTNVGYAMLADRVKATPATYTNGPKYAACGNGATGAARTAAVTDTALSAQVGSRVAGTETSVTTSVTNDTYQNVATISFSGSYNIDEFGLFDATSAGNMFFSATLSAIGVASGDAIQFTAKVAIS